MASCNWRQANRSSESDTDSESDIEGKILIFFMIMYLIKLAKGKLEIMLQGHNWYKVRSLLGN